jgi:hypothetical protein
MRTLLSCVLAVMLSLNATYVAVVGVCDAFEHQPENIDQPWHTAHFLHHSHNFSEHTAHDEPQANADQAEQMATLNDHQHNHVHSGFSTILPSSIGLLPHIEGSILLATHAESLVSAPQTLPDRPPRATLA